MMLSRRVCSFRWFTIKRHYNGTANKLQAVALQTNEVENEEYNEVAQYPEIKDLSYNGRKKSEDLSFHEEVKRACTVEEKTIKINMPRYYGYKVVKLHEECLPYNCLPAIKWYTRTLFEDLPSDVKEDEKLSSQVNDIKGDIQDAIELSHDYFSLKYTNAALEPKERERIWAQLIVEQINRALTNALLAEYQHLQECEVDFNPRHEAFWSVGGINPPINVVKYKEGVKMLKPFARDPVDRFMQYKSEPLLAIRHHLQLPPWKSEAEFTNFEKVKNLPRVEYDPRALGFLTHYQHVTNIPGYWPSNMVSFGVLSYQSRAGLHIRPNGLSAEDHNEALHAHAIQSSFAWLLAQASYNGFNTFSELTYPLNTQTILTDGKTWSFYEYQLNTLLMNGSYIDENPRVNYCRGTQELALYQEITDKGKVVGFNDQVLKCLIKFYTNIPNIQRTLQELQPFLNEKYKRAADYEKDDKREFLEKTFKHLCSNRPRHLAEPEIYLWEKIYKIDHKTRPLEARRRFFEVFVNPWKRTLDQHDKEYIPKILRPEVPKNKNRFKPTYYP